ncbi:DUF4097 family beta strand repeat-containing protein [Micromonospora sp. NBC_01796]|uniref:DUF4097 family beta strand repeat-containing protein n=1 Tax=Micromonospora sp. NBC_01796 TaxID=2975987 RepID=UPI002DDC61B3|nr:DUF4097 family beta strand repeat-containing protein [Micromonospora sp. NBC_01796]WSA84737.1 DUF4097 domain-containing protein [Micromonospora sp. NBC_01796]
MPNFDTPGPISATIDLVVGRARITATDRGQTVVEVQPNDHANELDVKAAEQTRVEFTDGKLLVKAPKLRTLFSNKVGSVEVTVELPAGSDVRAYASLADFDTEGRLGECRFKTSLGNIGLDRTGALHAHTSSGRVTVGHITGNTEVTTHSGDVEIRVVDGQAVIKNSNGDISIGEVTGDLRSNAANGDISVDRALGAVTAKTANGNVRIGEVVRGSVVIESAAGDLEVGIRRGTAAWLDVRSVSGRVRNDLDTSEGPGGSDETVEVRARTYAGGILIRRSTIAPAG